MPTSESSSTNSTDGSCDASGRIDSSAGVTVVGNNCLTATLFGEYGLVNLVRINTFDCVLGIVESS